jgi:hypothetical protein
LNKKEKDMYILETGISAEPVKLTGQQLKPGQCYRCITGESSNRRVSPRESGIRVGDIIYKLRNHANDPMPVTGFDILNLSNGRAYQGSDPEFKYEPIPPQNVVLRVNDQH